MYALLLLGGVFHKCASVMLTETPVTYILIDFLSAYLISYWKRPAKSSI
jgi:hypothetical protein